MKTIEQISKLNASILIELKKELESFNPNKRIISNLKKKSEYLRTIQMYLETNPSEDFLKKEHERLVNRLNKIIQGQPVNPESELAGVLEKYKKDKSIYNKTMGVQDVQNKINNIRFILTD